KIGGDATKLFEFRRLSRQNVMNEPGPTFKAVLPCDYELRIGQDRVRSVCFVLAETINGGRITATQLFEQFFCLFAELLERRTAGQTRCGIRHVDLLSIVPVSARGPKEDRDCRNGCSGGLSPFRGRDAACYA